MKDVKRLVTDHRRPLPLKATGSILESIGNTPLVRIKHRKRWRNAVEIYAKLEAFNPGGSVKDRAALYMIEDGERRGLLTKGKVILDSTSGNTGIAYAMIGAAKGYKVKLVVPASASEERKKILRAYGAEVVFSDPLEGSDGAILLCREVYAADPDRYFKPDQYNNPMNPRAHYETTAPEIWHQTSGTITHFVATLGTSGTLVGAGQRLKELNPKLEVVAVEPSSGFHGIEGLKHMESSIVPGIYRPEIHDRKLPIETEDAYDASMELAARDGIFAGQSSGAAFVAAQQLAKGLDAGVIVAIFPDAADKYLSTRLFSR
ncbi:MAG: cysteine synthase [Acidobacteriota bacterium]